MAPKLSSNIMGLRFMQRAAEKRQREEDGAKTTAKENEVGRVLAITAELPRR